MTQAPPALPAPITFIGGGNMARSLIGGLIASGVPAGVIRVVEPVAALRDALRDDFGVAVHEDAGAAVDGTRACVLAVKPQVMRGVCEALAPRLPVDALVVSIAAGITRAQLRHWLGGAARPLVRAMPNTPALLGAGVTGLQGEGLEDAQRAAAEALLRTVGAVAWIDDEALMDAVTAVSGSGPAYVFLLAESLGEAGIAQGLAPDTARLLAAHTLLGAARMLVESGEPADVLRRRVTSPGGTTQAAIETFEAGGLRALVADAVRAATERGRALSAANG